MSVLAMQAPRRADFDRAGDVMSFTEIILAVALGIILADSIAIVILGVRNAQLEAQLKERGNHA